MEDHFCLQWNNHQSVLISVLDTLLENERHVDCLLSADGRFLKAHKVILSACSSYLEELLTVHDDKYPILIFGDIKYNELKAVLEYMYRGKVEVVRDDLAAFLKAAEALQIKGLTENGGMPVKRKKKEETCSSGDDECSPSRSPSTTTRRRKKRRPFQVQSPPVLNVETTSNNSSDLATPLDDTPKPDDDPVVVTATTAPPSQDQPPISDSPLLPVNTSPPTDILVKQELDAPEYAEPKAECFFDIADDDNTDVPKLPDDVDDLLAPIPKLGSCDSSDSQVDERPSEEEDDDGGGGGGGDSGSDSSAVVLVSEGVADVSGEAERRLSERHFLVPIPPTHSKMHPTRVCHVCSRTIINPRKRRESRYMCFPCNKPLCVFPCMQVYHSSRIY